MAESSTSAVIGVTVFYMSAALTMVMTNKWVLNASALPLTFLLLQLGISVLCLTLLSFLPQNHKFKFTPPRWTASTILAVAPVCTANVVGLVFNIYCLKLVDASYFQVARGLTLPMTVVLQSLMTGEKPSRGTIASCGLVTWGFTYAFLPAPFVGGASNPSPVGAALVAGPEAPALGMVLGVFSAAMVAVHAVLIKAALKSVDGKTLDLAYWQNALSAIALLPAILFSGEVKSFVRMASGVEGSFRAFATGSALTGIVGFLICIAGLLSIKVTSPVTHMFSSAVRSVLQTILGVWLFHDTLNINRFMSIFLILVGSVLYTYLRSRPAPVKSVEDREALVKAINGDAEKGMGMGVGMGEKRYGDLGAGKGSRKASPVMR